ncbi:hypothetical protein I6N96_06760 [Enterococcus sp. BWM-S5]|uniref:Uncharacterized protein n=1 Tax=Enterococcus larvae TaxID=2794352 RepID=A0ABS4CHE1_9ENTE|nr:hypothetical protein [Enterococcus larvae]MBP1045977.1 hypothetical protein [Enterococcus larvae]
MNREEAKRKLSFHSSRNEDIEDPFWENGFVRLLRPFKGKQLLEEAFHEVVQLTYLLADCIQEEQVNKEMIADFWTIVHLGKSWGSSDEVFTDSELQKIAYFTEQISYPVFCLLDGTDKETAFEMYAHDYPEKMVQLENSII